MITVETVTIGNEILMGDTLDSNTNWVCKLITQMGGRIVRGATVRDELEMIIDVVSGALQRKPRLLLILGGLGPTLDDGTLAAVARATGHNLEVNQEALDFVTNRYAEFASKGYVDDASITPARRKMALLPQGAVPLGNPVGTAPGVLLEINGTSIINLPGVPSELKGVVESAVLPILKPLFENSVFIRRVLVADTKDESVLSPILAGVSEQYPQVHIKSKPKSFGVDVKFRIVVTAYGEPKDDIAAALAEAVDHVEAALTSNNIGYQFVEE